jgi:hypothetical protein
MPKLVQAKNYDLKRNFSTLESSLQLSKKYVNSANLIAWLRFYSQDKPKNEINKPENSNAQYVGTLSFFDAVVDGPFGRRILKAIEPQDDQSCVILEGKSADSLLLDGETPFGLSFWIKKSNEAEKINLLSLEGLMTIEDEGEGEEEENDSQNIQIEKLNISIDFSNDDSELFVTFFDHSQDENNPEKKIFELQFSIADDEWSHLALSFDPKENGVSQIKLWIDGVECLQKLFFEDAGYQGPVLTESNVLKFGKVEIDNSTTFSELAIWSSVLSEESFEAVRIGTTSKVIFEQSGFLSESPRLQIRNLDHATGSYPGNSSHGMPDFNGRYDVNFNDTKALNFISNYAKASIELNPFDPNDSTNVLRDFSKLDKLIFEFKLFNGDNFIEISFLYVAQASRLDVGTDNVIVINAIQARTADDMMLLMSKAINDAKIGVEARSVGRKIIVRYHKPSIGSFQSGSRIEVLGDSFSVVKEIKQFAIDQEDLLWPAMVPSSSRYSEINRVTPHRLDGIEAPGQMIIGISDSHIKFTPGQDIKPFNEYFVPNVDSDPFYASGTEANVLPNFSAKLSSKNSVVIDLSHGEGESAVYFSTGSDPATGLKDFERNSGISYYDFSNKAWQPKGLSEELEFYSSDVSVATGSMLSIIPSTFWGTFPNLEEVPLNLDNIRHIGKPHSFSGFPQANKFDASKNQLIKMRDHIKGPFLVEKVELEVNGILGAYPPYNSRLNRQKVQDLIYTNVSGTSLLGRNVQIYYESVASIEPIVELAIENGNYVITIKFRSGITTAQQIIDAVESVTSPVGANILQVALDPTGNSSNPQIVEEIYEFISE